MHLKLLFLLTIIVFTFIYLNNLPGTNSSNSIEIKPTVYACVRTKNSFKHLNEFIAFHKLVGITHFHILDDSNRPMNIQSTKYITYEYVGNIQIRNENDHLIRCMQSAILVSKADYVMNLDDDEFVYPSRTHFLPEWKKCINSLFAISSVFLWHNKIPQHWLNNN